MDYNYKYITVNTNNQTLVITLNRPHKKNALNQEMVQEIKSILDLYETDQKIRIILISSSCDAFCSGADLEYLKKIKDFSYKENLKDSQELMLLFQKMLLYPKLIISKVSGVAIAGGCGLMTASDIIFATHDSTFGYPEVKIGFVPALVSTFLKEKITDLKARELLLTGKIINANTAMEIGLINYICSAEKIDQEIISFIEKFTKHTSPNSIAQTKKIMYHSLSLGDKLIKAAELNAKTRMSLDFQRGINAFLEKQSINWQEN